MGVVGLVGLAARGHSAGRGAVGNLDGPRLAVELEEDADIAGLGSGGSLLGSGGHGGAGDQQQGRGDEAGHAVLLVPPS